MDGVAFTDAAGRVVAVSPGFLEILGLSANDAIGRNYRSLMGEAPGAAVCVHERRLALSGANGEAGGVCIIVTRATGTPPPAQDATSEVAAQLSAVNERLRREIDERRDAERKLEMAVVELMEHDLAKTRFVSNVSHELKTPLVSMKYAVGNLMRGMIGPLPDSALLYLGMLRDDCQRLTRTVTDILDLSRLETATLTLSLVTTPLWPLVRQAAESLRIQAEQRGHKLVVRPPRTTGFVRCDREKLTRAMINVIGNAIKYTPDDGGIQVDVAPAAPGGGQHTVAVTDNGIGIPAEFLPRVTERYFRCGEQVSGTGLGLAITKDIIELHDGTLSIASPPPDAAAGTRVTIRLAVAPAPVVCVIAGAGTEKEPIVQALRRMGYGVVPMLSGTCSAVDLHAVRADIVLLVVLEDSFDDVTLAAEIVRDERLGGRPFLAVSGPAEDSTKAEILRGLRIPLLAPPWREEDLLDCIERAELGKLP